LLPVIQFDAFEVRRAREHGAAGTGDRATRRMKPVSISPVAEMSRILDKTSLASHTVKKAPGMIPAPHAHILY